MKIDKLIKELIEVYNYAESNAAGTRNEYAKEKSGKYVYLRMKALMIIKSAYGDDVIYKTTEEATSVKEISLEHDNSVLVLTKFKSAISALTMTLKDIVDEQLISSADVKKTESKRDVTNNVFLVHGRNTEDLNKIEKYVKELGYNPIVLYKDIEPGMTIIEKLEKHSDVFAAIVLLTPDDEGKLTSEESFKTRARQNVVFEYGYFIGVLGRKSIIVVDYGVEEKPSDVHGIALTNNNDRLEKTFKEIAEGLTKIKNKQ